MVRAMQSAAIVRENQINMFKILSLLISLIALGCGSEKELERIIEQHTVNQVVELPAPIIDKAKQIIEEENEYRLMAGQAMLSEGLTCTLYNLQATTPGSIPSNPPTAVATFVYKGPFNQPNSSAQDGLNILPEALRVVYKQWYLIKCQGQFVATHSDYYQFNLTSDDGSKLYLDNALLIDNDGHHGAQLRSGSKLLKRGVHTFRLDYMQGPAGNQALILEDAQDTISGNLFYR